MNKTLIVILSLIIFLLSTLLVSAYGFDVAYTPIKDDIYINEGAVFEVTVVNNLDVENRYRISVGDFTEWSVETDPQSYKLSGILVEPKKSKTFELRIYPKNIRHGQKSVKITMKSEDTKEEIRKYIKINIKSEYTIPSYLPSIGLKIYLPSEGKIDPRKDAVFRIELKNKNLLSLEDVELELKSNLIEGKKTGITLEPLERKVEDFTIKFNPVEIPKKETLVATATVENRTFVSIEDFYIISYYEDFLQKEETKKKILKWIREISVVNTGNAEKDETIKIKTTSLRSLFSYTKPKAEIIKDGEQRYFVWSLKLGPQESETLYIILNFRPIFTLLLIVAVAILMYYHRRSPVVIKKSYSDLSIKHKGISKLTIVLNVRNRSKKVLTDIEVIDRIPSITDIEREFKVGSLHPAKILKHKQKGTILKWEIESLESGEERVINYVMKSKLVILGMFKIPQAIVRCRTEQGIKSSAKSNSLTISP